jgi:hypothetical protein
MEDFGSASAAFLFPQSFSIRCIASPHVYIFIYTHMHAQATQRALKKAASALPSLSLSLLHPCCDLAITFSFLPSGSTRLILCIIHNNFAPPTSLFSPLCELSLRVHCSVSFSCVCGAKINNPKTYPILYNSQCRAWAPRFVYS